VIAPSVAQQISTAASTLIFIIPDPIVCGVSSWFGLRDWHGRSNHDVKPPANGCVANSGSKTCLRRVVCFRGQYPRGFCRACLPKWELTNSICNTTISRGDPMAQPPLTLNQTCAKPPSTNTSLPVIKLLSSEARNKATAAVSSGLPTRSRGA
jgi:hypothetical protein